MTNPMFTFTFDDPYSWHTQEEWDYLHTVEGIVNTKMQESAAAFDKVIEDFYFYGQSRLGFNEDGSAYPLPWKYSL